MKRKLLSALLVTAMTVGLLAGCGGSSNETAATETETKTEAEN